MSELKYEACTPRRERDPLKQLDLRDGPKYSSTRANVHARAHAHVHAHVGSAWGWAGRVQVRERGVQQSGRVSGKVV